MSPAAVLILVATALDGSPDVPAAAVKASVGRAVTRIETGLTNYPEHRTCFSCHHQAMGLMSLTAAKRRGFEVDAKVVSDAVAFSLRTFRNRGAIAKGQGVGGDSTGVGYVLHALAAVGHKPDDTTAALVDYLLVKQRKDGTWPIAAFGDRPPTMGSLFTNAGLAVFALRTFAPADDAPGTEDRRRRASAAVEKARDWLLANKPVSTEDKVFHLRGLVDAGAGVRSVAVARTGLLADQLADGSWAQLAGMTGDAYATATVLTAMRHAGLEPAHAAYRRGLKYLLDTQTEEGAWIVKTRTKPLQVYFDNGDAGGKSQFISFAATNWAVLALLEAIPEPVPGRGDDPKK